MFLHVVDGDVALGAMFPGGLSTSDVGDEVLLVGARVQGDGGRPVFERTELVELQRDRIEQSLLLNLVCENID